LFWRYRTGEKYTEMIRAEDRIAALDIATEIYEERLKTQGYLFAEFNEVFGARHKEPQR
jgi:hypothetical protein